MKKKITLLVSLISIMSLMAGCSSNSSSNQSDNVISSESTDTTSSSSEDKVNTITFSNAAALVSTLESNEYLKSNGANIVTSTNTNGYIIKKEENTKVYSDGSSSSTGSLIRTSPMGRVLNEDTFVSRKKRQIDAYSVDSKESTYNMYYSIYDYDKAELTSYTDSASCVFIVNTVSDANAGGLSEGQYILESEYNKYTSSQVCVQVETALDDLYNDDYVLAKGISTINYEQLDNGNYRYYLEVTYSYDGDLNDTYSITKSLSYEISKDLTKLLNVTYNVTTNDTSKSDPDDTYVSATNYQATLSYDTRSEVDESSLINVNDYFLENVTEVNVLTNNSKGDREVVDPSEITYNGGYSYIFLEAKTYTPSKAVNISLTNKSSSDDEVVKLESSGHFAIVGPGNATLTATYSGKDEFGVYVEKEVTVNVTITQKEVSEFSLYTATCRVYRTETDSETGELSQGEYLSEITKAYDNTMYEKNNYTFTIQANASKTASYVATSSDESKAKVVVNNGSVTVYALSKGEVTITVSLQDKPEVSYKIRFTILSSEDVESVLKGKTYTVDRMIYNWKGEITFNEDGKTGSKTIYNYSSDSDTPKVTTTTFNYEVIDGYIILDDNEYSFASLTNNGSNLYFEYNSGHHDYKVKA
jgi:hypothetical protein